MEIKKAKTKSELIREKLDSGIPMIEIIVEGMWGSLKTAPAYNDQREIYRLANRDFSNNDYSDATKYIDSLVQLCDFFEEQLNNVYQELSSLGYDVDEWGGLIEPETKQEDPHA